ncbi:MAG TPA: hypothetical protein EYP60_03950 [bacterium (Candidatus Stahlbacteria)]|nr:hypothetical protein [Candidatus Stahlbacteria bacterium]
MSKKNHRKLWRPGGKLSELGPRALIDEEVVATLISSGMRGRSALDIAREIIEKFGSVREIANLRPEKLYKIKGMGKVKINRLMAAIEIARRIIEELVKEKEVENIVSRDQLQLFLARSQEIKPPEPTKRKRINIKGDEWTRLSISIWNDISKNREERALNHPAMFPSQLVRRLVRIFSQDHDVILDPFLGVGSTLIGAVLEGRSGVGFEIVPEYALKANERLKFIYTSDIFRPVQVLYVEKPQMISFSNQETKIVICNVDAREIDKCLLPSSIDLCITSPPYANILTRKRTADRKDTKKYSELKEDLGNISDYNKFLTELSNIFSKVIKILKPKSHFIIIVMDIRQGPNFIPYHIDVINSLANLGLKFCDLIIWDRRNDYSNLRPLGYPYKFIVNKIHEYILIFQKI